MAGAYSRFGNDSQEYFRQLITGSDTEVQPEETTGIMSRSRFAGRGAPVAIDTPPEQPEAPNTAFFENFARRLGRSSDDPERVADAVLNVSQPVRPTGGLDDWENMPDVDTVLAPRPDQTREALGGASATPQDATMVAGYSIEDSETFIGGSSVQKQLNDLGFRTSVDGAIGPRTRQNIGRYQVSIGLPATGYVDSATQEALQAGQKGRPLNEIESELPFLGQTAVGSVLRAAEDMYYSPYTLNFQPVLPGNRKHNSGLTIGAGIDLGQYDADRLRSYGAPEEIVTKLESSGWLGLRPSNAVSNNDNFRRQGHAALQSRYEEQLANGTLLSLTPEEIDTLTSVLYENQYLPIVQDAYNRTATSRRVPFDALSEQAVAAMAAEAWHRPASIASNADAFARAAANNDIAGITDLYFYPERGPKILTALGVR
jgi:hypothetical protein